MIWKRWGMERLLSSRNLFMKVIDGCGCMGWGLNIIIRLVKRFRNGDEKFFFFLLEDLCRGGGGECFILVVVEGELSLLGRYCGM